MSKLSILNRILSISAIMALPFSGLFFGLSSTAFADETGGKAVVLKFVPKKKQNSENEIAGNLYSKKEFIARIKANFRIEKDSAGEEHFRDRELEITSYKGAPIAFIKEHINLKKHLATYQIFDSKNSIFLTGEKSYLDPANTDTSIRLFRDQASAGQISFTQDQSGETNWTIVLSQRNLVPDAAIYSLLIFDTFFDDQLRSKGWSKKAIVAGIVTGTAIIAGAVIYYNPELLDAIINPATRIAMMDYITLTTQNWYAWIRSFRIFGTQYPALPMVPGQTEEVCIHPLRKGINIIVEDGILGPCRKLHRGDIFVHIRLPRWAEWFSKMKLNYGTDGPVTFSPLAE